MHSKQNDQPHWNTLDLILLLAVGGLMVAHLVHLSPTGHKIALLLAVIMLYGLMGLWVRSNAAALRHLDNLHSQEPTPAPASTQTMKRSPAKRVLPKQGTRV